MRRVKVSVWWDHADIKSMLIWCRENNIPIVQFRSERLRGSRLAFNYLLLDMAKRYADYLWFESVWIIRSQDYVLWRMLFEQPNDQMKEISNDKTHA